MNQGNQNTNQTNQRKPDVVPNGVPTITNIIIQATKELAKNVLVKSGGHLKIVGNARNSGTPANLIQNTQALSIVGQVPVSWGVDCSLGIMAQSKINQVMQTGGDFIIFPIVESAQSHYGVCIFNRKTQELGIYSTGSKLLDSSRYPKATVKDHDSNLKYFLSNTNNLVIENGKTLIRLDNFDRDQVRSIINRFHIKDNEYYNVSIDKGQRYILKLEYQPNEKGERKNDIDWSKCNTSDWIVKIDSNKLAAFKKLAQKIAVETNSKRLFSPYASLSEYIKTFTGIQYYDQWVEQSADVNDLTESKLTDKVSIKSFSNLRQVQNSCFTIPTIISLLCLQSEIHKDDAFMKVVESGKVEDMFQYIETKAKENDSWIQAQKVLQAIDNSQHSQQTKANSGDTIGVKDTTLDHVVQKVAGIILNPKIQKTHIKATKPTATPPLDQLASSNPVAQNATEDHLTQLARTFFNAKGITITNKSQESVQYEKNGASYTVAINAGNRPANYQHKGEAINLMHAFDLSSHPASICKNPSNSANLLTIIPMINYQGNHVGMAIYNHRTTKLSIYATNTDIIGDMPKSASNKLLVNQNNSWDTITLTRAEYLAILNSVNADKLDVTHNANPDTFTIRPKSTFINSDADAVNTTLSEINWLKYIANIIPHADSDNLYKSWLNEDTKSIDLNRVEIKQFKNLTQLPNSCYTIPSVISLYLTQEIKNNSAELSQAIESDAIFDYIEKKASENQSWQDLQRYFQFAACINDSGLPITQEELTSASNAQAELLEYIYAKIDPQKELAADQDISKSVKSVKSVRPNDIDLDNKSSITNKSQTKKTERADSSGGQPLSPSLAPEKGDTESLVKSVLSPKTQSQKKTDRALGLNLSKNRNKKPQGSSVIRNLIQGIVRQIQSIFKLLKLSDKKQGLNSKSKTIPRRSKIYASNQKLKYTSHMSQKRGFGRLS